MARLTVRQPGIGTRHPDSAEIRQSTGPRGGMPAGHRARRPVLLVVAGVLLITLAFGAFSAFKLRALAIDASQHASAGRDDIAQGAKVLTAGSAITKSQLAVAADDFRRAEGEFQTAHHRVTDGRLINFLALVPVASKQILATRDLTDMGIHSARAGELAVQILSSLVSGDAPSGTALKLGPTEKILQIIQALDPQLSAVEAELNAVATDRRHIPSSGLIAPLAKAVVAFDAKFDAQKAKSLLASVRAEEQPVKLLLGAAGSRSYLVLQQDPAELRATGGFIGSVGFLNFDHGRMAPYQPIDVYALDGRDQYGFLLGPKGSPKHVDPPPPLEKTFRLVSWQLRDSNWSPDFPTAAQQAEFFLEREVNRKVDGVIAIDPFFISKLLTITGPVKIAETGDTVNEANFFQITTTRVNVQPDGSTKQFLSFAARAIFARLVEIPPAKWTSVLQALGHGCEDRSLQAYFADPVLESFVWRHGCGGQFRPLQSDGVMIVDSNINGSKDDFWLNRRFDLRVDMQPNGSMIHTLHLHYGGLTSHGKLTGTWGYTGWLRIYLPPSTKIISTSGASLDATDDLGRHVLQGWLYVQFGSQADIAIVYRVDPPTSAKQAHSLDILWQKQAGRQGDPIKVTLALPTGWRVRSAQLGASKLTTPIITTDLSVDREIHFDYEHQAP